MYTHKKCDNCNRMLVKDSEVTAIIPKVLVGKDGHLKLSVDGVEIRAAKVYCKKCLDIETHILKEKNDSA